MKQKILKALLLFSWIASATILSLGIIAILEKSIEGFNYPLLSIIVVFFSISLAVFTPYIFCIVFGGTFMDYHNKNILLEGRIKELITEYEDTITLLRKIIKILKEQDLNKNETQPLTSPNNNNKPYTCAAAKIGINGCLLNNINNEELS